MERFDRIQAAVRDERMQALSDRRFYSIAGAQWEGPLGEQFENKPKFEVNKVHLSVIRVINEYRNNRITVDFVSKDGAESDEMADACDDLYRAMEQDSVADEAYDNAFEEAVGGGFGAFRLRAEYEDEEDEEDERQKICIEPIFDADSCVFFDLDAKRQDKADATHCFVLSSMTHAAYKYEWGDDPATWPKDITQAEFDWCTPDLVYVAEYYVVETKRTIVEVWETLLGEEQRYRDEEFEEDEDLRARLIATGRRKVREKRIKDKKVRKYILSGARVLDDCGHIAGKCIPVIPVYGKRWFVDGVERFMGHVRLSKDAQRLKNMQLSKLGDISARSSVRKPILTPEQIAGHQVMWSEDNIKDYPYLLVNPIMDAAGNMVNSGPVSYLDAPDVPQALAALLQITEQDMQDLLGNQQAGEELTPNVSGKAVELIQNKLDMQSFIYMSNMAKAIKRAGEVWLSMARDVYVETGRKMKGITAQGSPNTVELAKPMLDKKTGAAVVANDFSRAKYDVAVDVGPSSSSKRASTVRALTGMAAITDDPETRQVLTSMAMMNMEGEGISDVRDYFRRKMVAAGVVKPTDEEAQELAVAQANQPPSSQDVYLQAAAQEASAKAGKAQADTLLTVAKVEQTKADTIKTVTETDAAEQAQALDVIDRFVPAQPQAPDVTVVSAEPPQI